MQLISFITNFKIRIAEKNTPILNPYIFLNAYVMLNVYELLNSKETVFIGSTPENDIVFNDTQTSPRHCQISKVDPGVYLIVDLNSAAGTYINNERIRTGFAMETDLIKVGNNEFQIRNNNKNIVNPTQRKLYDKNPQPAKPSPNKPYKENRSSDLKKNSNTQLQPEYTDEIRTDITRQISASVYLNAALRDKIINFAKDPYHPIVKSAGLDDLVVLRHSLNSKHKEKDYYWLIFFPSLVFWGTVLITISNNGDFFGGVTGLIAIGMYVVMFIIILIKDLNQQKFVKENFSKDNTAKDFVYSGPGIDLIKEMQAKMCSNVIFYSGFSPFVGSGIDVGGWSFVVDIDKGKKEMGAESEPKNFDEIELYKQVTDELLGLNIDNMAVYNKAFFNGKNIRNNKELLPDILGFPVNQISSELMQKVMNCEIKGARYYKVIQITDWEGDLVLTSFLRFQKNEKTLFVENNYFLLPPVAENLKEIDRIKMNSGIRYFIALFVSAALMTFVKSLLSFAKILGYIGEGIESALGSSKSAYKKLVKCSPDFDYGSGTSLREAFSQGNYLQHFQKLDKERYFKIIEKRIFNSMCSFLDRKNIDTSQFQERETSILNNGVIVTGGNLSSENLVVGKKAKVDFTKNK